MESATRLRGKKTITILFAGVVELYSEREADPSSNSDIEIK
jgi:hypothetical protein